MEASTAFTNNTITSTHLPKIEQLNAEPLSPRYSKANVVINCVISFILCCIFAFIKLQSFFTLPKEPLGVITVVLLVFIAFFIVNIGLRYMSDQQKSYALREQDISYSSGLIFRKTVTQPILRIQHVELKRGPIDRKVGLAKLQVFSAGGAMHTFEIPGLTLELAESIRQFILDHKDVNNNG